jgi:hypothetical protein
LAAALADASVEAAPAHLLATVATLVGKLSLTADGANAVGRATANATRLADCVLRHSTLAPIGAITSIATIAILVGAACLFSPNRTAEFDPPANAIETNRQSAATTSAIVRSTARPDAATLLASAQAIVEAMVEGEDKFHLVIRLAQVQAKRGERAAADRTFHQAIDIAEGVISHGGTAGLYVRVPIAQAEVGLFHEAVQAAWKLPDRRYGVRCLADVAANQARLGDFAGAKRTIERIRAVTPADFPEALPPGPSLEGIVNDTLTSALVSFAREQISRRDLDSALDSVHAIPDKIEHVSLLARIAVASADSGRAAAAYDRLREAEDVFRTTCAGQRAQPQTIATNQAFLLAAKLRISSPTAVGHEADTIAGEAKDAFLVIQAYRYVRNGDVEQAEHVVEEIDDTPYRDDALLAIAWARAKRRELVPALRHAGAIADDWNRSVALAELARRQAGEGDLAGALDTLASAERDVVESRRCNPNGLLGRSGHYELAQALAAIGAEDRAIAWGETESAAAERSSILIGVADALLSRRRPTAGTIAQMTRRRRFFDL